MAQANLSENTGKQTATSEDLICEGGQINHTVRLNFSQHFVHYCISWKCADPGRPLRRIFPSSAVQTFVSLCCCLLLLSLSTLLIGSPWFAKTELCHYAVTIHPFASLLLSSVSLFKMTTIKVDRLFTQLMGMRYRQVVTWSKHTSPFGSCPLSLECRTFSIPV